MFHNRREYLFLYDVSYGNPNGDPNDENKPRIDGDSGKNIVTDVRLKRTIRDYLADFEGLEIFIKEVSDSDKGGIQDAKARAKDFGNEKEKILEKCIDIRLFGGTIPIKVDKDKGSSITFTGPVQFNMGQSLHRVKLEYIKGTGAFASKEGKQKTFREEWILPYSLIAFHGVANENASRETNLTDQDLDLLIKAMWYGTKNLITRSKNEHVPRLLIEIIYKKDIHSHIGELHRFVKIDTDKQDEELRGPDDYVLNIDRLIENIKLEASKIDKIRYKIDKNFRLNNSFNVETLKFEEMNI